MRYPGFHAELGRMKYPPLFRYTASVIMNSVYDYDPSSQHDESTALVANVIDVASSAIQPEVALVVGAFPARE